MKTLTRSVGEPGAPGGIRARGDNRTECWALVEWRDLPGLDWALIKELCELGVRAAAETGRWAAIATSNFCEPQFV